MSSSRLPIEINEEGEAMRHSPVLLDAAVHWLSPTPGGALVDCTVGAGGHAERLLEMVGPAGRLIGIDRDPSAIAAASDRLSRFGRSFIPVQGDYRDILQTLSRLGIGPVDGILADLGVSSLQLLDPSRGFSFAADGPLDMRMDRTNGETAASLLARLGEKDLAYLLKRCGEEPQSRAIARAIVRVRQRTPIIRTGHLADIVTRAARWRTRSRIHPATRTFMALRIAVNDELSGLERFIEEATEALRPGGRLCAISFHSLEDRIVKRAIRSLASRCTCPPRLPVCGCGRANLIRVLTLRPATPSASEVEENPRSRGARLRAAERL